MTKEQWTELMNDTNLPWPVIIDDTLKASIDAYYEQYGAK